MYMTRGCRMCFNFSFATGMDLEAAIRSFVTPCFSLCPTQAHGQAVRGAGAGWQCSAFLVWLWCRCCASSRVSHVIGKLFGSISADPHNAQILPHTALKSSAGLYSSKRLHLIRSWSGARRDAPRSLHPLVSPRVDGMSPGLGLRRLTWLRML